MNNLAIKKLVMQLIRTGFSMIRFLVRANARNIAVIGVLEHPATNAPIPANMYVFGAFSGIKLPTIKPVAPPKIKPPSRR